MTLAGKKVFNNTLIIYSKTITGMVISLISTRIVLSALGEVDFGIYNLVGGVTAMLTFLNVALSSSTQRYLSYYYGYGDFNLLRTVFKYAIILHFGIALVVGIGLEVLGVFFLENVLVVPDHRIESALNVLHYMTIGTFFTIVSSPFTGFLIAKENMVSISVIGLVEVMLKLIVAIVLMGVVEIDVLSYYAFSIALISFFSFLAMVLVCHLKYKESNLILVFRSKGSKTKILKEMGAFAGWNLIGCLFGLARGQGIALLLNTFFGVIVNAAYGIANQVNGQLLFFSSSIMMAIRPQLIKSEAVNNRKRMIHFAMAGSKYTFLAISVLSIPLLVELPFLLKLWLKEVPENTMMFSFLIIAVTLVAQLTQGLIVAVEAVGKIKWLQLTVGVLHVVNLPVGWYLLKIGLNPYSVLVSVLVEETICGVFRIYLAKRLIGLNIFEYVERVVVKPLIVFVISVVITYGISLLLPEGFLRVIAVVFTGLVSIVSFGYIIALTVEEREFYRTIYLKIKAAIFSFN